MSGTWEVRHLQLHLLLGCPRHTCCTYSVAPPATGPSVTTTPPVSTPPVTIAPPPVTANLNNPLSKQFSGQLAAGVTGNGGNPNGTYTGYQWNYFAQRTWGDYNDPHVNGSANYTLSQYIQLYLNNLIATNVYPPGTGLNGLGCAMCGRSSCVGCSGLYGLGVSLTDLTYSRMVERRPGLQYRMVLSTWRIEVKWMWRQVNV